MKEDKYEIEDNIFKMKPARGPETAKEASQASKQSKQVMQGSIASKQCKEALQASNAGQP